jgi:uncharacterized membrane protein
MALLAIAAGAISAYLALVKLGGGTPACGVLHGCETVSNSQYSEVLGIPVGLLGFAAALLTLGGAVLWWIRSDRRGLLAAYVIGLLSLPFIAWLTYLEFFVIHAICIWCVAYAIFVIAGWVVASVALWRSPQVTR